jgi:hypothetical protein
LARRQDQHAAASQKRKIRSRSRALKDQFVRP